MAKLEEVNMKYIVTTVWKHPAKIDWQSMRQTMSKSKDNPNVAEIHWYEIDETTHGSVAIYHSKEAMRLTLPLWRNIARSRLVSVALKCSTKHMVRAMSTSPLFKQIHTFKWAEAKEAKGANDG